MPAIHRTVTEDALGTAKGLRCTRGHHRERPIGGAGGTTAHWRIEKIDASAQGGYLLFGDDSTIDPVALVQIVQNASQRFRLQGSHKLSFRLDLSDVDKRFEAIEDLLQRLGVKQQSKQAS